ncbi:MAG TPA: hypothetical protein ENK52_01485 [Saprospiraceae bacterium]|nr:hypothetical protein [Saprospiraceae bacterium]
MEKHGVTFKDFACASANIVGGMSLDQVCNVLGIEEPLWAEVKEFWNNKMASLSMDDMKFYGEVFTNPKQGKFANVEGGVGGVEEVLEKYPEWSDCIKMEKYMEHASNVGIEIDFDKEFGISLAQYTQLASHWSAYFKEKVMDVASSYNIDEGMDEEQLESVRINELHSELRDKWDAYYKEKFAGQSAGISDDIDF